MKQKGSLYRRGDFWILRYRETINRGGVLETKQRAKQLCSVDERHKTKRSVWIDPDVKAAIERVLADVNEGNKVPETLVTLKAFVTDNYIPFAKQHKRSSTSVMYGNMWNVHCSRLVGDVLLRNVRTCDVQFWLERIAREDRTKHKTPLSHETLKRIKSLLSGIFSHAKRQGFFDGANPVQNTAVPPAPKGAITYAYSRAEVNRMILLAPEPASTLLAVAAYTGMRRSEIEGLCWEDYRDGAIYISRSISYGVVNEPKTRASQAPVPVVPYLASVLATHRQRLGNPKSGPMFPAVNGKPVSLNNVLNRSIRPALAKAKVKWHGWHALRRGLATNLHDLGVDDKTIQAILRHSDVSVTMRCYIKTLPAQSVAAMSALESSMFAECALEQGSNKRQYTN